MADYPAVAFTEPFTLLVRTAVRLAPRVFYAVQGVNSLGSVETWVSMGQPDLRGATHTHATVIGQWYSPY